MMHGADPGSQRAGQAGEDDLEPRGRHPQRQAAAVDRAADRDRARCRQQHRRLAAADRQRVLFRPHPAARSVRQDASRTSSPAAAAKSATRSPTTACEWVRVRARHRCRRLARHRGRLHQVRHRDDDGRGRRAQEDATRSPIGWRCSRARRAQRTCCNACAEMASYSQEARWPRGRHRLFGCAAQPHCRWRPKSRSTPRPARSRSIISGPRSMPARRCSRRTSSRRSKAR